MNWVSGISATGSGAAAGDSIPGVRSGVQSAFVVTTNQPQRLTVCVQEEAVLSTATKEAANVPPRTTQHVTSTVGLKHESALGLQGCALPVEGAAQVFFSGVECLEEKAISASLYRRKNKRKVSYSSVYKSHPSIRCAQLFTRFSGGDYYIEISNPCTRCIPHFWCSILG